MTSIQATYRNESNLPQLEATHEACLLAPVLLSHKEGCILFSKVSMTHIAKRKAHVDFSNHISNESIVATGGQKVHFIFQIFAVLIKMKFYDLIYCFSHSGRVV